MKNVTVVMVSLLLSFGAFGQDEIEGYWLAGEGKSIVEIYSTDAANQNGKIAWMENPTDKKGRPHTDKMNPDKDLRNRPILGLDILKDLAYSDGNWIGKIYVPKRGKTLDVALSLVEQDRLKLTVSFRGFSKNQFWTRTEHPE